MLMMCVENVALNHHHQIFCLLMFHKFLTFKLLQVLKHLDNRRLVHKEAINFCQNVLRNKFVDCIPVSRHDLSQPIRDVDLVITIGGDGTLLQGSHFLDDKIPVLGVNSDPTQAREVSCCFDNHGSPGFNCFLNLRVPKLISQAQNDPFAKRNTCVITFVWCRSMKILMLQGALAIFVQLLLITLNK